MIFVDWHWRKPKPQDLSSLHNSGLSRTANRLARNLGLARVCLGDCRPRNAFPSRQSRLRYSATTRQVRSQRLVGLQPPDTGKRAFPENRDNSTSPDLHTERELCQDRRPAIHRQTHVQRRRTIPFQARKAKLSDASPVYMRLSRNENANLLLHLNFA